MSGTILLKFFFFFSFNDREWVDRGGPHREHENGGGNNRRWVDWHGGTKEEPHVDYRRQGPPMMSQEIVEGRGEMYPRRHPHQQNDMHSGPYHHKGKFFQIKKKKEIFSFKFS